MMKKTICALLAVLTVSATFAACKGDDSTTGNSTVQSVSSVEESSVGDREESSVGDESETETQIKVSAPSAKISGVQGNSIGLKKYLIAEGEEEYDVHFWYTFSGYGAMGANGAEALQITEKTEIAGASLQADYCGEYKIYFVAKQGGVTISAPDAYFTIVTEDESVPQITAAQDINYDENGVAVGAFLSQHVEVTDSYYTSLDVTVTKVNGIDFTGDTMTIVEGNNTVTVSVNDGFGHVVTQDVSVKLTASIAEDLTVLAARGGKVTHNFDAYCSLLAFESSSLANSTVSTVDAIEGKSLLLDNTDNAPTVKFLENNMLALSGEYKVTFDYKVLTETMPDYFCVGFNGTAQVNRENWFSGRADAVGETYQFEYTFELAEGEYYLQIFNLNANGSKIVIDNIVIENVTSDTQKLTDLNVVGGKLTHDFDEKLVLGDFTSSSLANSTVSTEYAIEGNSLLLDNTGSAPTIKFLENNMLAMGGQYKVTFDYKVLTETMPDYFCVGFNGTAQQNRENWFSGRADAVGTTYQFEHTFELAEGMYYLQIFSLGANGSKIAIDNIVIENVTADTQKLTDLNVVGGKLTHDFDEKLILGDFTSSALVNSTVSTEYAIEGNSLLLDNTGSAPTVKFLENNMLALNGKYKVTFDYKVLTETMPDYFCVGFNGTTQVNRENWFSGRTDVVGETYQFEFTFTLSEGMYYLQIFSLGANGSQIVIDNIQIEKIN